MKYLTLTFLVALALCSACNTNMELTEKDILEIKQLEKDYVNGWFEKNQKEAVISVFEKEAAFIPHHGDSPVIGVKNLEAFFWPDGVGGIVHKFNHYPDTIEGNNQIAWIRGRFDIKYSWINNTDTTTTLNEGNYVIIARKQKESQWKIATFIFNDPVAQIED